MKKHLLLLSMFITSLYGCSSKNCEVQTSSGIETIPITDFETIYGKLSDFAEEVKMIPLELHLYKCNSKVIYR